MEDYLRVIAEPAQLLGGRVNLVGDCQGGWLAVMYTAPASRYCRHAHNCRCTRRLPRRRALIHDWIRLPSPLGQMDIYRVLVTANGGVLPGDALLTGFKIMQPEAETDRQLQLLAQIDDGAYTERYRKFENWFQHTQPIPGGSTSGSSSISSYVTSSSTAS